MKKLLILLILSVAQSPRMRSMKGSGKAMTGN